MSSILPTGLCPTPRLGRYAGPCARSTPSRAAPCAGLAGLGEYRSARIQASQPGRDPRRRSSWPPRPWAGAWSASTPGLHHARRAYVRRVRTPDVRVTTFDGSIQIKTWDKDQVLVEIEKRGPTEEALKSLEVVAEQTGNHIQVEVRRPSGGESFFGIGNFSRSAKSSRRCPQGERGGLERRRLDPDRARGRALRVAHRRRLGARQQHRGRRRRAHRRRSVTLQDVSGAVDLTTGDGGVSLSGALGGVRVETGDGSVTVRADQGSRMADDWTVRTGDGSVVLYLPSDFAAELDAHTSDGRVTSDLEVTTTVSGRIDKKTLKGRLGEGGRTLRIRTGDGSIRLECPRSGAARAPFTGHRSAPGPFGATGGAASVQLADSPERTRILLNEQDRSERTGIPRTNGITPTG